MGYFAIECPLSVIRQSHSERYSFANDYSHPTIIKRGIFVQVMIELAKRK